MPELSPAEALGRIEQLREEVAYHDDLYYMKASPEISDAEYDALKRKLHLLEMKYPNIDDHSSLSSGVGDDRTGAFPERPHAVPMLSLEKAYSDSDLKAFHEKVSKLGATGEVEFFVEPKVDGIAISLVYEDGRFARAVTRGNGRSGEDVSENVKRLSGLPMDLKNVSGGEAKVPEHVELRGEVFLTFAAFERLNRERESAGAPTFSHPRNVAAGSLKLSNSEEVAERGLSLVIFGYGDYQPAAERPASQEAFYQLAEAWGLPILETVRVARGEGELMAATHAVHAERESYPFPTDGVVAKVNQLALQESLGASDFAPRWAIARKFPAERMETRLIGIALQVGRTGILAPVAELEPVTLSGSKIGRATLHNSGYIAAMDLRLGDSVFVEKAGEVVPAIVGVNLSRRAVDSEAFRFPETCPSCGAGLYEDGATIRCPNDLRCPEQLQQRVAYFVSKQAVDIDGLGEQTIRDLIDAGLVSGFSDLFRLDEERLTGLEGFSHVSIKNLLQAIEVGKTAELWRYVKGFSIPGLGTVRSKEIARVYPSLQDLLKMKRSDFEVGGRASGGGLGVAARDATLAFFLEERNREMVSDLIKLGVSPMVDFGVGAGGLPLSGKSFALTGKLPNLTRSEATRLIENAGGEVRSALNASTDFLVVGDRPGQKREKAQELGVAVIEERALLELLRP